jgi:ATP-dependent Clp endopeptidase proteolytic subunit ClpP
VPGAPVADWIDIYNRLYRERIIFLGQQIDDDLANQIIAVMLYSDSESQKSQTMYINSPGGSVTAGLALHDTMQHIKSKVSTVNIGMAASMGSFILGAGERGQRVALPHSRVMIHQPMGGGIQGQAEDIKTEAEQILRVKDKLVNMYSQMTGRPREQIIQDIDRDNFMSAQEALEYGLIDRIVESDRKESRKEYVKGSIDDILNS